MGLIWLFQRDKCIISLWFDDEDCAVNISIGEKSE